MIPQEKVDAALDAVLRASGSALKYYTMPSTLDGMREAYRDSLLEHVEMVKKLRAAEEYWRLLAEKNGADKKRMDWLEAKGGMIGIDNIGNGDYRHYAGEMFESLRDVVDAAIHASNGHS